MSDKYLNKIKIGWDIGGAHVKYCVVSDHLNTIWYDIIDFEFWKEYKNLNSLINNVNTVYKKKKFQVDNYFTMSAEMCDCFDNRETGVSYIIDQVNKSNCISYIYSRTGFIDTRVIKKSSYMDIGSFNWYATAEYISSFSSNAIVVDFGSTTCDFIIIKDGKVQNKRLSDIVGLQTNELLYSGCARTPIYMHINKISYKNKIYHIIPEQFSSMSDIYVILDKLNPKDIYSKSSNGADYTKINAYKRVSRSFGFDFTNKKLNLIKYLSKQIYDTQIKLIENYILYHKKKYFNRRQEIKIMGIGLGYNTISEICKKNKLSYVNINDYLESKINYGSVLAKLFPSYAMCRLSE